MLTVSSRAQNPLRSRPHPHVTYSKEADSWFERISPVPVGATSRPSRRRRGRQLNMKDSIVGAAQRVEPVGPHRGFPRAQNAVRSRPRPQNTYFKNADSWFERISPVPADATSRPTRRRRGRRLTVKYSTRRDARRVAPVGAHRGFPRAQNAVRSRPRPQRACLKDADSWFERISPVPAGAMSRPTRRVAAVGSQ